MSLDAQEAVVGATGHIWRAPVDTPFPANISTEVDEALWAELGYTTEEGVRFNFGRDINEIMAWQSLDPIRVIVQGLPKEIAHDFRQFNQNTWATAMGGGTWSGSAPDFVYTPPAPSYVDEFAEIVQFEDGDELYRFCFYRVMNTSGVEFASVRDDTVILPVTVKVLAPPAGVDHPFIFQTTDASLGDATLSGS